MKKLLALLMAFTLTFQLVTPVFAEEIEETQVTTEAVEVETEAPATEAPTEAPTTEIPTTEPPTTAVPETVSPEEISAPTEPQVTEATETTASTEETTTAATEPTEETTEDVEETESEMNLFASSDDFQPLWPLKKSYFVKALDVYSSGSAHRGIDIISNGYPTQDVFAVADGTVVEIYNSCGHHNAPNDKCGNTYGNNVKLKHVVNGVTYYSRYAHLTKDSIVVELGATVGAGDKIAQMGSSGSSTAPHLHLTITDSDESGEARSRSFDYYMNNAELLSSCGVGFNKDMTAYSPRYGAWIREHCDVGSDGHYYFSHTHNYVTEYEKAHPHKEYKKCYACGNWYYTGATRAVDGCSDCHPMVYLDLNGYLDGRDSGYLEDYGTCDVYINGVKVADDCSDFVQYFPVGTAYSIEDIRATNGHQYIGEKKIWDQSGNTGVSFGTLSGTLTQNQEVVLEFKSLVYLDLNGYLDGRDAGSLEDYGTCDVYIDGVKAADDCADFVKYYPVGTTYSIEDIRATNGHQYIGEKADVRDEAGNTSVSFGSTLSGTLTKNQEVILEFKTVNQEGKCGDNLTWSLDGSGVLTISGSGDMWDFEQDGSNAAPWIGRKLTKLVLSDGITSIGNNALYKCSDITGELVLPSNLKTIGKGAFEYCSGFSGSLTFPETLMEIKAFAFSDCSGFSGDLILPDGLTAIRAFTFNECEGLNGSLKLPKNLKTIEANAFRACHNLTGKLELPETLTELGGVAFGGCNFTGGLRIPGSVTVVGDNAFYHCQGFTGTLEFSEGITTILGYSFASCTGFTDVILPESITKIGVASFRDMTGLRDVHYAGTAEQWKNISIESDNSPLTSANIHYNETVASGNCGDNLTWNLNSAGRLTISGTGVMWDYEWCQDGDVVYSSAPWGNLNVTNLVLEEGITRIGACAFLDCATIEGKLNLPSTLQEIGDTAFSGCYRLYGTLNIPSGVKEIGDCAFQGCYGLTGTLNLPKSLTYIGEATFNGCSGLTGTLVIPGNVLNIGDWAFRDCSGFIGKMVIPGKVAVIGEYAFAGCTGIEEVTIPLSVLIIEAGAFADCTSLSDVYYTGDRAHWNHISIGEQNETLHNANMHFTGSEVISRLEIRPTATNTLTARSKLTLSAWDSGKKAKVKWSLAEGDEAYAAISSSGVLTAKTVSEVQNITVIAAPTDGSPEAQKIIQILPKITIKQREKFNLFYRNGSAELSITGCEIEEAQFVASSDFVLEDNDGKFDIRLAQDAPAKPKTKVTLEIKLSGCDTPIRQNLTIATTNTAPKLKLNPTVSIVNTTLTDSLTVEAAILGTDDESLTARSATKGVTASIEDGVLTLTLDTDKTTTANVYIQGDGWAKEVKVTHKITVTNKKPTVKFTAKGKLDVLNPASEIVYTPKLTNATGTITDIRLEGQDADLFHAEVVDGLIHLTLAKPGENYSTKTTYKVTPTVTLLGKEITGSALSVKATQSTLKLAKIPNQTVSKSAPEDLTVKLAITSPLTAQIGDVKLNAKTTAALRNALEAAGGIELDEGTVSFPAETFTSLKPGKYTVILDVSPANAATNSKPIQAKFTLTVQK